MTSKTLPATQIGVLSLPDSVKLQSFPVPQPGPGEVLIQNVAVASNPKDWKYPSWDPEYANIEGSDAAGIIVAVGEGVTEYKGGERVAAFNKMGTKENKHGCYAQYTVTPASTTFPIPDSVSFEEASTIPLAAMTAAIALFINLGFPEQPTEPQQGIIINGAATSVGAYAIQLAKRAGLYVIGVAGSSKDYAKELGADVVVDYRAHKGDDLEGALVKAAEGRRVSRVLDTISENGSIVLLSRVLAKTSPDGKGKVEYILFLSKEEEKLIPQGITTHQTWVSSAYGDDEAFAARFYRQISKWLEVTPENPKPFKPNRVRVLPNGLASVEKGLLLLKNGEVHGEKLVYRIAETPGLQ